MLDLEAREERYVVVVELDAADRVGHHVAHEALGLLVDVFGVDQDFTDVGRVVVADGADDQARFLINQQRRFIGLCGTVDGGPQLQQIVQVPLQLFYCAADTGAVRAMMLMPLGTSSCAMVSRSSLRSSPSIRRETPPPRGLFGISTR